MLGKIQTIYFEEINENIKKKKANLLAEKSWLVITAESQARKRAQTLVTRWYSERAISAETP